MSDIFSAQQVFLLRYFACIKRRRTWWKCLSADIIGLLQPAQSISENYNSFMSQQIAEVLNENLRQSKIDKANQDRIDFWKNR
jgi:hypothetical protein